MSVMRDYCDTEIVVGTKLIYFRELISGRRTLMITVSSITARESIIADIEYPESNKKHRSWTEIHSSCIADYITLYNVKRYYPEYLV